MVAGICPQTPLFAGMTMKDGNSHQYLPLILFFTVLILLRKIARYVGEMGGLQVTLPPEC